MALGNGNGGHEGGVRDPETDRARLRAIHGALTSGDVAAAGKMAEDALGDGIDHVMVLSLVAGRREEEGRFDEALALLQRAKAAAPDAAGIINQVGLCLLRMKLWGEAAAEFGEALACDSSFAPALANRATALMALGRFDRARRDFEAAAALDPANLVAVNGLAALALRRGDAAQARALAERVLGREPGFPGAVLTLAGADVAEGRAEAAESALRQLIGDRALQPADRVIAHGLLGEALDAQARFDEAFEAWRESNAVRKSQAGPAPGGGPGMAASVRDLGARLQGRRIPAAFGQSGRGPARRHVFLLGFPRSGTTLVGQVLAGNSEIVTLAEEDCLIDAARAWMRDAERFEAFCAAPDEALDDHRAEYWRRVAEAGVDAAGRVFVDKLSLNTIKLPLIARLFPEARVLLARRDPRDNVLSCFLHAFQMTAPANPLLTLEGAADLFAATMEMAAASETAFGLFMHEVPLEALIADPEGATRNICEYVGVECTDGMRGAAAAVARGGPSPRGIGKWRDYEAQMAPVLPVLAPWVKRFQAA